MNYFRPAIATMQGYTPGEQPKPGSPIIKLNTNENPYPPSPKALEVLHSLDSEWLRRYPDPYSRDFCTLSYSSIIAGCGGSRSCLS